MLLAVSNDHAFGGIPLTTKILNNQTFHWHDPPTNCSGDIGYFGVVPVWESTTTRELTTRVFSLQPWWNSTEFALEESEYIQLMGLVGQVWIAVPTASSNVTSPSQMEFISCQLYNSSLTINVNFTDYVSTITVIKNIWMNDLDASDLSASDFRDDLDTEEDPDLWKNNEMFSYFAYFQTIGTHLIGSDSWWYAGNARYINADNIEMLNTYLATSSQVYYMDQKINAAAMRASNTDYMDKVRDISFVKDIEDLALNSILSLLSDVTLWYVSHTTPYLNTHKIGF
jgi:hypothetical protein